MTRRPAAACAVLCAAMAAGYLSMWAGRGPVTIFSWYGTVTALGMLALAAGACSIAAGLRAPGGGGLSWPWLLNGAALVALGVLHFGRTFRISLLAVALLAAVMAAATAVLQRRLAWRHPAGDTWWFVLAGAAPAGLAAVLLALGLRWIPVEPETHRDLFWLGAFFASCAASLLAATGRLTRPLVPDPGSSAAAPQQGPPP